MAWWSKQKKQEPSLDMQERIRRGEVVISPDYSGPPKLTPEEQEEWDRLNAELEARFGK